MVFLFGLMVENMKANGKTESSTEKGFIHWHLQKKKLAFG